MVSQNNNNKTVLRIPSKNARDQKKKKKKDFMQLFIADATIFSKEF